MNGTPRGYDWFYPDGAKLTIWRDDDLGIWRSSSFNPALPVESDHRVIELWHDDCETVEEVLAYIEDGGFLTAEMHAEALELLSAAKPDPGPWRFHRGQPWDWTASVVVDGVRWTANATREEAAACLKCEHEYDGWYLQAGDMQLLRGLAKRIAAPADVLEMLSHDLPKVTP